MVEAMELGSYHIVKKLATGGMAEIFLARHQSLEGFQRQIVLKRILPEYSGDKNFVDAFLNEAKLAAQLNHPNIVQIYDLGRLAKSYFIAMEYIRGYDLTSLLRFHRQRQDHLPLAVALRIFCDVCAGLDYAHHAADIDGHPLAIVHRDVTPSNVLVSLDGPAKLLDFGIAKATAKGDNKTKTGTVKGKFAYLAPEQVLGQDLDKRADIFAAGITLYEMITGGNPFRGDTEYRTLQNIVSITVPPIASKRSGVPPGFDAVIANALQRSPADRYASCGDFQRAVEEEAHKAGIIFTHADVHAYMDANSVAIDEIEASHKTDEVSDLSGAVLSLGQTDPGVDELPAGSLEPIGDSRKQLLPWIATGVAACALIAAVVLLTIRGSTHQQAAPPAITAIDVVTEPAGAHVLLNGVLLTGATPLRIADAKVGTRYDIVVGAPGYRDAKTQVSLDQPGVRVVQLELANEAKAEPKPRVEAKRRDTTPKPVAVVSHDPGRLRVVVQPWGSVDVDGKHVGETPFAPLELSAGTHLVVIENADLRKKITKRVTIAPGQEAVLRENLTRD